MRIYQKEKELKKIQKDLDNAKKNINTLYKAEIELAKIMTTHKGDIDALGATLKCLLGATDTINKILLPERFREPKFKDLQKICKDNFLARQLFGLIFKETKKGEEENE